MEILFIFLALFFAGKKFLFNGDDLFNLKTEFCSYEISSIKINVLIDCCNYAKGEKFFDYILGFYIHSFCEFTNLDFFPNFDYLLCRFKLSYFFLYFLLFRFFLPVFPARYRTGFLPSKGIEIFLFDDDFSLEDSFFLKLSLLCILFFYLFKKSFSFPLFLFLYSLIRFGLNKGKIFFEILFISLFKYLCYLFLFLFADDLDVAL